MTRRNRQQPQQSAEALPPHSLEAELAVLGGILLDNEGLRRIGAKISARDFYDLRNGLIFEAMVELGSRAQPIDTVTIGAWLQGRDVLERAGGLEHVLSITNSVPLVANIEEHARIIREKAIERSVRESLARAHLAATTGDMRAALEAVDVAHAQAAQFKTRATPSAFDSMRTVGEWAIDTDVTPPEPSWLFMRPDPDVPDLDEWIGVMECGTVAMLPGMPGAGKSTIKLWCALAIATGIDWLGWRATTTGRVLFATAEEKIEQVHRRLHRLVHSVGLTPEQHALMQRNLVLWPIRGVDAQLTYDRERGYKPTPFGEELIARCAAVPHAAVILDPLSRFASPDVETDNHAGTAFVAQLERLSTLPSSPTIFVTHHTAKGADAEDIYAARGSSSLSGAVKWQANVIVASTPKNRRWGVRIAVVKSNWADYAPDVILKWVGGALRVTTKAERSEFWAAVAGSKKTRKAA